MTFDDFFLEFDILEICHLSPDTFEEELTQENRLVRSSVVKDHSRSIRMSFTGHLLLDDHGDFHRKSWSCLSFQGEWIKGFSSGGRCISSCDHGCQYWTNPQYEIEISAEDPTMKCALVLSLMQKYNRRKPTDNPMDRYDYIQVEFVPCSGDLSPSSSIDSRRESIASNRVRPLHRDRMDDSC